MRSYAGLFGARSRVLALGPETDDLVESLRAQGIDAFEVHDSGSADVSTVLTGIEHLEDRSLGGILTVRLVDRLSVEELQRFLEVSRRKLGPGGVLVAETEDRLDAGLARSSAMAPEALLELCRLTGFEQAYVLFPAGTASAEPDEANHGEFAIVASVLMPTSR
jgi:hypothetical protein